MVVVFQKDMGNQITKDDKITILRQMKPNTVSKLER